MTWQRLTRARDEISLCQQTSAIPLQVSRVKTLITTKPLTNAFYIRRLSA